MKRLWNNVWRVGAKLCSVPRESLCSQACDHCASLSRKWVRHDCVEENHMQTSITWHSLSCKRLVLGRLTLHSLALRRSYRKPENHVGCSRLVIFTTLAPIKAQNNAEIHWEHFLCKIKRHIFLLLTKMLLQAPSSSGHMRKRLGVPLDLCWRVKSANLISGPPLQQTHTSWT